MIARKGLRMILANKPSLNYLYLRCHVDYHDGATESAEVSCRLPRVRFAELLGG